jgi:hypothetical protein
MPNEFEEKYMGVLQNIEFGIVKIFRQNSELMDWDVLQTLDALIKKYKAEAASRPEPVLALNEQRQNLFDSVKAMCDLNLGRAKLLDRKGFPVTLTVVNVDEIIQCLKRIHRSVEFWNKKNGRQGYLNFIIEHVH